MTQVVAVKLSLVSSVYPQKCKGTEGHTVHSGLAIISNKKPVAGQPDISIKHTVSREERPGEIHPKAGVSKASETIICGQQSPKYLLSGLCLLLL